MQEAFQRGPTTPPKKATAVAQLCAAKRELRLCVARPDFSKVNELDFFFNGKSPDFQKLATNSN